ncbi:hypothetical protein B9Z55_000664 [Caenorhabditis nigoni]|uniref:Transmembrane protein n=1 Tax=Caenorhabditis nigoni TaxID=1611254 RepID=A0A2G5VUX3_9PELO|nr:hypothetical protein B9Z55_000664 [Caenorhabditis nigoni]
MSNFQEGKKVEGKKKKKSILKILKFIFFNNWILKKPSLPTQKNIYTQSSRSNFLKNPEMNISIFLPALLLGTTCPLLVSKILQRAQKRKIQPTMNNNKNQQKFSIPHSIRLSFFVC